MEILSTLERYTYQLAKRNVIREHSPFNLLSRQIAKWSYSEVLGISTRSVDMSCHVTEPSFVAYIFQSCKIAPGFEVSTHIPLSSKCVCVCCSQNSIGDCVGGETCLEYKGRAFCHLWGLPTISFNLKP